MNVLLADIRARQWRLVLTRPKAINACARLDTNWMLLETYVRTSTNVLLVKSVRLIPIVRIRQARSHANARQASR